MSRFDRSLIRLAVLGACLGAIALGLSACGRRGPLEMPPGVAMTPQGPVEFDAQGRPIAPQGERKRLPIDALLD